MHSIRNHKRAFLRSAVLASALMASTAAVAGPPLLCHPFDTGGSASLPWGDDWNRVDRGYDRARLPADTVRLLDANAPVIARMETLRRAAIYASANGASLRDLAARLDARAAAARSSQAKAGALFDAGYFSETLQDIARLQGYDMPGIGKVDMRALNAVLAKGDGSLRIAQALELAPQDVAMRFGSALVASADERSSDYTRHARLARSGARSDRLVAMNYPAASRGVSEKPKPEKPSDTAAPSHCDSYGCTRSSVKLTYAASGGEWTRRDSTSTSSPTEAAGRPWDHGGIHPHGCRYEIPTHHDSRPRPGRHVALLL